MSFDSAEFRRVLGSYPTGVTVVTAQCVDGPAGMTVGSFASVSLDPPLVSFCPASASTTWMRMSKVGSFCVNVLGADQLDICKTFASEVPDRFDGLSIRAEITGAPVINGCLAWIDCETYATHDGGDHSVVIGKVVGIGTESQSEPLVFLGGNFGTFAEL